MACRPEQTLNHGTSLRPRRQRPTTRRRETRNDDTILEPSLSTIFALLRPPVYPTRTTSAVVAKVEVVHAAGGGVVIKECGDVEDEGCGAMAPMGLHGNGSLLLRRGE